jgi:hypothetical protein
MLKTDAYPAKFFKAKNFPDDWSLTVEVEMARMEKFENGKDDRERLVVYFRKQQSGLVVGPVIWDQFIEVTGEQDSDKWKGHWVQLFRAWTIFGGENVKCIRVRKPDEPVKKPVKKKPVNKDDSGQS